MLEPGRLPALDLSQQQLCLRDVPEKRMQMRKNHSTLESLATAVVLEWSPSRGTTDAMSQWRGLSCKRSASHTWPRVGTKKGNTKDQQDRIRGFWFWGFWEKGERWGSQDEEVEGQARLSAEGLCQSACSNPHRRYPIQYHLHSR